VARPSDKWTDFRIINMIQREMSGQLALHRERAPGFQRESHLRLIGQVERDMTTLDHSSIDVAPLDIEKTLSRRGVLQAIDHLDRSVAFNNLRQQEFVGRGTAAMIAEGEKQRRSY
jgi:hypothetical protein